MRVVNIPDLSKEVIGEPWPPPYHPDVRLIVTRTVTEDDETETLHVIGFLKKGSNKLVDGAGEEIEGTIRPGDFLDSYETFTRLQFTLLQRANAGEKQPTKDSPEEPQPQKN